MSVHICNRRRVFPTLFLFVLFLNFVWAPPVRAALININTAGSSELQTLSGIGPAYAQRIIDYRNANGLFQKIEEISNVKGIGLPGSKSYEDIKDYITVGSVGSSGGGASEDLVSDEVPLTPVTSSETISTHYGSTPITNVSSTVGSAIGAGRDRVGVVGSPLEFRAEMNQPYSRQNIFSWNFGDGMQGGGAVLNHVYEYPGEYVVVLKVSLSDDEAVSRVNVKIMNPQLAITDVSSDRIEITNNSSYEINLFGRALLSGGEAFVFLQDTIIKSGKSISFSQKATGLNPVGMHDANLIVVGDSIGGVALRNKIEEEKLTKIDEIREQITVLEQRKLALIRAQAQPVGANVIEIGVSQNQNSDDAEVAIQSQTAYVAQSIESDSWFETLKKFFLRTR